MSNKENILRKIKNLLELAENNPSEQEALSASLMAQKLINKYNIEVAQLEGSDEQSIDTVFFETGVDKSWKYSLGNIVGENFRCKTYWIGSRQVAFMGYSQDIEIAKEVFKTLFKTCDTLGRRLQKKAYVKTGTSAGVYASYTKGFVAGVRKKLGEQCTALLIVTPQEVTDAFAEFCKSPTVKSSPVKPRKDAMNARALNQGFQDGKDAVSSKRLK